MVGSGVACCGSDPNSRWRSLLGRVVLVGDDLGARLPEEIDAAHVVDVALGEQDVADGA
jgi:hypothetical protein